MEMHHPSVFQSVKMDHSTVFQSVEMDHYSVFQSVEMDHFNELGHGESRDRNRGRVSVKTARVCGGCVVCTVAYTSEPLFRSR